MLKLIGEAVPSWAEGRDIWPLVTGEKKKNYDHVTCCFKDYFWARDQNWALVGRSDKTELELFDLVKDPQYLVNVAERHPAEVETSLGGSCWPPGGRLPVYNSTDKLLERQK